MVDSNNSHEVYRQFADSRYAKSLAEAIRFSPFKPEGLPNSAWIDVLGRDVCNLRHMPLTYGLTSWFLRQSQTQELLHNGNSDNASNVNGFGLPYQAEDLRHSESPVFNPTNDDRKLMLVAAMIHDQHEAICGDMPDPEKTVDDRVNETALLRGLVEEIYSDDSLRLVEINRAIDLVLADQESPLGKAFRCIEVMGYVRTAFTAWRKALDLDSGKLLPSYADYTNGLLLETIDSLGQLARTVVRTSVPGLLLTKDYYPAINRFFEIQTRDEAGQELLREVNSTIPVNFSG